MIKIEKIRVNLVKIKSNTKFEMTFYEKYF